MVAYNYPEGDDLIALVVTSGDGTSMSIVKIDGHYDAKAEIAWLRFEDYDLKVVVAEETDFGLRELDPTDRHVVGLEYWHAS